MTIVDEINLALKQYNKGKKNYAYKKIIKIFLKNKNNLKLRYNVAVIEQDLGLFKKAEENYKYLINNNFDIRSKINLYNLYIKQNQFNNALVLIEEVIKENDQILITYQDKANVLYKLKNYDESINECKSIIKLDPQNIKILNLLGLCYLKKENFDLAKDTFLNALNIDQNNIITLNYLGRLNHEIRNSKEAEKYFLKAIKLNPNIFETLNNIAGFYLEEAEYDKALNFFKKAEEINSQNSILLDNIAKTYTSIGKTIEAEKYCKAAIKLNSSDDNIKKTLSLIHLKNYNFKKAWEYFDGRLNLSDFVAKNSTINLIKHKIPKHTNIDKSAKILVIREQGVGDEILYGTMYADLLKEFPNATIECDERLIPLFKNSFEITNENKFVKLGLHSSNKNEINKFKYIIYAGSLGKFFRNDVKSFPSTPYLTKLDSYNDPELDKIIKDFNGLKIGISWKSFKNRYALEKSLKLNNFNHLFNLKNCIFFNLQYGNVDKELSHFIKKTNFKIISLKDLDLFNNIVGIVNLLSKLDFFITVSNSTAHIAGALGIKTILIKPISHASFHYWDYNNNKTPWYKNVKIISKEDLLNKKIISQLFI